uniref:Innexin n=1 Tax=Panagrolaimus sp. PS1159 TaxID=55785 RepID=A0AC35G1P5_9BILA
MFALGLSIFAQEYTGDPLKCWAKPSWHSSWLQYAEDYCFIEGTYAIKLNESLPHPSDYDQHKKITFYQWIPFIFYLMGIMLQLPRFFWSFINWTSYLHLTGFCNVAVDSFRHHPVHKKSNIEVYVAHFEDAINRKCKKTKDKKVFTSVNGAVKAVYGAWNNKVSPRYLYGAYLSLKIWNILNTVLLLIILNRLIADQWNDILGFSTISTLISPTPWTESDIFPRITICNFVVREMGKKDETEFANKTAQCVLAAHMFVEKFFVFVWFWLAALTLLNIAGLILWCTRFINERAEKFLKGYIESGTVFVDFMKHKREAVQKEAEKLKKEGMQLEIEAAVAAAKEEVIKKKPAIIEAKNKNVAGGYINDVEIKKLVDKKPIVTDSTVIDMEMTDAQKKEEHNARLKEWEERRKQLQRNNRMTDAEREEFIKEQEKFYLKNVKNYLSAFRKNLGPDGLLTLYMISLNASTSVAAQIISQFFFDFIIKEEEKREKSNDFPPEYDGYAKSGSSDITSILKV